MACVNSDGTLSPSGKAMLNAMQEVHTPEEIAKSAKLPLFRVRSGIREMISAGLVEEQQGKYSITELGLQKIEA